MVKIIVLEDPDFPEDNAHALGLQDALVRQYEQQDIPVDTVLTGDELDALIAGNAPRGESYVILGAGERQLANLAALKQPNVSTLWSGHHPPAGLLEASRNLDVVHLPEDALTPALKAGLGNRLVASLRGMPHSLTDAAFGKLRPMPARHGDKPASSAGIGR